MTHQMLLEQYHRLSKLGIVPERTELLRGVVVEKTTQSPLHVYLVRWLFDWLTDHVAVGYYIRQRAALTFVDSELEPDLAVVRGDLNDHRDAHPSTADLIVEVAITSVELDREKGAIYAAAGVGEYWIVIPQEQAVEVYTLPTVDGYQAMQRREDVDQSLETPTLPGCSITLRELFD